MYALIYFNQFSLGDNNLLTIHLPTSVRSKLLSYLILLNQSITSQYFFLCPFVSTYKAQLNDKSYVGFP